MNWFRRLFAAEGGSILVLAALTLTAVMGMSSLAVEMGTGYAAKMRNQRVADMAALGGALAYQASSSSQASQQATPEQKARQTATDIVTASGLPATAATVTVGASSVQVQITTAVPIKLAAMLTNSVSYNVTNSAVASFTSNTAPACVLALSKTASAGVDMQGNTSLNTTGCAVTSNSPISVGGSSELTASTITAPSTDVTGSSHINGTTTTGSNAADPLANNSALTAAFAQLGTTTSVVMPAAPTFTATTTNWSFPGSASGYSALPNTDPVKANCTLSVQIYTCNQGAYNINNLTVASGMTVTFTGVSTVNIYGTFSADGATLGGSQTSYNLRNGFVSGWGGPKFGNIASLYVGGAVTYSGNGNSIGNGNVTIAGALSIGGGSSLTIGAGTHAFGGVSVGGSSILTVGNGNLTVNGSISVQGSATATFGDGNYVIGHDGNGDAINIQGTLVMGAGDFSADGNISTNGGTSITIGAGRHTIDGNVSIQSGGTLGAGLYLINGDFDKNAHNTVTANGVTIVAAGSFSTGGGAGLVLTAPTDDSTTNGGIGGIAFASKTSKASSIGGSSSNTLGGIFYLPNSDLSVSGAGTMAGATCMALVVDTLTISGSGAISNTNCSAPSLSSQGTVSLIQ
jgi:hypothetical protein